MALLTAGTVVHTAQVDNGGIIEDHTHGWVFALVGSIDDDKLVFDNNLVKIDSYLRPGVRTFTWEATRAGYDTVSTVVFLDVGDVGVTTTGYLQIPAGTSPIDWSNDFEVSFSLYRTGTQLFAHYVLFGNGSNDSLRISGVDELNWRVGGSEQVADITIPINKWTEFRLVGTSGPDEVKLYKNGSLVHTRVGTIDWPSPIVSGYLVNQGGNDTMIMSNLLVKTGGVVRVREELSVDSGILTENGTVTFDGTLRKEI